MPRAVVILGAGSSADFGVPTLARMFKDPHARAFLQAKPRLLNMLNSVFWRPRGHILNTSEKSINIEQMLTTLKDCEKEDALSPEQKPQDISGFRKGLLCLIQKGVFEGKSSNGQHLNALIRTCSKTFEHTTWASFNWDCIFEASFWYRQPVGVRVNPSLAIPVADWRQGTSKHTFLKLHGGINWWLVNDCVTYVRWTRGGELTQKWREYERETVTQDRPVILEPSFYKYDETEYKQLAPQWHRFIEDLLQAQCVIVVGYSMPEMDVRARAKILTGFQVNQDCKWLVIDPTESVCDLYGRLLGNKRLTTFEQTLAGFNNDILANLSIAFPTIDFQE